MRSAVIVTAAFAAVAFGTPLKRDLIVETDTATDIDYVTDIITVTAGEAAPATSAAAAVTTTVAAAAAPSFHWGHHWSHHSSAAAASTSEAPAPAPVAPSSSSAAAPAPSSYSAPAPVSSSSSEAAPAPSSAPATSSTSVAATSASAAAAATASTYQQAVLYHHNFHRANHSAPDLVWDTNMADLAAEIASTCYYAHNMSLGTYGQNIAAGIASPNISYVISDMFYNGEVNAFNGLYGQTDPTADGFENWGHFSQIVWKSTTSVGCATKYCPSPASSPNTPGLANLPSSNIPSYFTVCNYSPPGNYANEYAANIGNSLNEPTVTYSKDITNPQGAGVTGNGVAGLVGTN